MSLGRFLFSPSEGRVCHGAMSRIWKGSKTSVRWNDLTASCVICLSRLSIRRSRWGTWTTHQRATFCVIWRRRRWHPLVSWHTKLGSRLWGKKRNCTFYKFRRHTTWDHVTSSRSLIGQKQQPELKKQGTDAVHRLSAIIQVLLAFFH